VNQAQTELTPPQLPIYCRKEKETKVPLADRHEDILRILELRERVSVAELTDRLGVSEVTVRKDLSLLEEHGHLVRTRGGARLAQDRARLEPIERRLEARPDAKDAIGRYAARLVREGETLFLDSGSTCLALARAVRRMDLRVVTNSLDVLNVLADSPSIVLHAITARFTSLSLEGVFSAQNAIESDVKRAVIAQAARTIVLTDASKIGQAAFSIFARPEQVQMVVTNPVAGAQAERISELRSSAPFEILFIDTEEES